MDEIKVLVKNLKVFLNIDGEYSLISQEEDVFSELGNMKNEKIDESLEESNNLPHLARFVDSNNLEDKLINDIQNELKKIGILSNGNLVTLKHKDHPRKELKNIEDGKVYITEVSIKFGFREDYFNSKLRQNESFNSKALEQFRNEIEKLRQDETSLENIEINKCVDKIIELIDIYAEESKKLFIEQASHASAIKTETKNGTSSRDEENEIIIVTREDIDEVELKWWSNFKKKYGSDNVKIKIIEKGDVILNQIIDSQKYRLFIDPNKEIPSKVQKIFSREDFIRPSSKYFKDAYEKGLYGSLLYRWTPLIGEYMNIPYLGFTTNDEKFRFGEHIAEAIEAYAQNRDAMTIKNAAIISVMKTCGYDDVQIKNFYDEMGKVRFHTMRLKVVGPIFNEILSKFKMEVVELDKTAIIGHDRETSYIKGEVDGRNYITHGLNSAYGSKESLNEINYPMYDICAMLMYGYSQGNIRKTLHQFYDLKVSKDMIKRLLVKVFYKTDESGENSRYLANKRFMKPIIEMMTIEQILTREKKAKIITREEFQEIRALLQEIVDENDYRGRNTWLGQWLKGKEKLDFKQWQKYEPWKKSVDWESIKDLIMEKTRERKYYGILESKWIQWAIDHLSYTEITEKTMMTQKQIRTVYKKIASKTEIFNEFKKRLIIQCRKDGMSWKKIYENALEYKRIGSSFIESYFIKEYNYLFRGSISSIDKLNAIDFSKPEYEISPIWKTKRTNGDDLIIDFREYSNYLIP